MKERLIGAAVLVAAGVWLIPMVLDGPERMDGLTDAPDLRLPVPEDDARSGSSVRESISRSQSVEVGGGPNQSVATGEQPDPESVADSASDDADSPADDAGEAVANEPAASDQTGNDQTGNEPVAEAPGQNAREAAASTTVERPVPPAPEPEAVPEAVAESPAPQPEAPGWMVQLGSFGQADNARRQVERVAGYGHRASISEFQSSGGLLYRVRVGPLPTREQAEATASSLAAHGLAADVINPD